MTIVNGARCTWWDDIENAASRPVQGQPEFPMPCCPYCGGVLFQQDDETDFLLSAEKYEAAGHPGYVDMVKWGKGKCFPTLAELKAAYEQSQKKSI